METDTENRLAVAKTEAVEGRDGLGVWDEQMQTSEYRINKQQGPAVEPSQLYSISCDYGKEKKSQNKGRIFFLPFQCDQRRQNVWKPVPLDFSLKTTGTKSSGRRQHTVLRERHIFGGSFMPPIWAPALSRRPAHGGLGVGRSRSCSGQAQHQVPR